MPDPVPNVEEWKRDMQLRRKGFRTGWSPSYEKANRELNLTPQEQHLYQHHLGNLQRGGYTNPDGSISTVFNTTMGVGDRTYVLPTVWDNKIISPQESLQRAQAQGLQNWPSYGSEKEASSRYNAMHGYMENDMRDWFHPQ